MKIKLGTKDLSQYHVRLLGDNGITGLINKDEHGIYWLDLPDVHVAVVKSRNDNTPMFYNIMKGNRVIMFIDVSSDAVHIAPPEPKKDHKGYDPDKDDYVLRLRDRLDALDSIVERTTKGTTLINIPTLLHYLQELQKEDPVKHDQVISTSLCYEILLRLFPVWTDHHKLQLLYDKIDSGLPYGVPYVISELDSKKRQILAEEVPKTFAQSRAWLTETQLNNLKKNVTDILKKYSSTVQFSLFGHPLEINYKFIACGNLGHHHEARVRAVINAINDPSTTETQVLKILNQQRDLMTKSDFNVNDTSNKVNFNVLALRWQNQLPTRRCLSPELQRTSGYLKVIDEALVRVSPQPVAQHHPEQNVMS